MPNIIDKFSLKAKMPIDERFVFDTQEQMRACAPNTLYDGLKSWCVELQKEQMWSEAKQDWIDVASSIDTSEFVRQDELAELSEDFFITKEQVVEFNENVSADFVKREELEELSSDFFLTKDQVDEFNENIGADFVKRAELDAFDTSLILTKEQVDEFNENVSADFVKRAELDTFDTGLILTQEQIEEFNARVDDTYVRVGELTPIDPDVLDMSSVEKINTALNELKTFTSNYQQNLEAKKYVMQDELSEIDFDDLMARLEAIEVKLGIK